MVHKRVMSKVKRIRKVCWLPLMLRYSRFSFVWVYIYTHVCVCVYNVNIMCILYSSLHHQHVATGETWIPFEGCKEIGLFTHKT